jgi:hypothetical protein
MPRLKPDHESSEVPKLDGGSVDQLLRPHNGILIIIARKATPCYDLAFVS